MPYLVKHNPFSSFASIVRNQARWSHIEDEAALFADLLNAEFPDYAWFTPNIWSDGHWVDGTKTDPKRPGFEEEGCNHYSLLRIIEQNFSLGHLGKNDAGCNWFQFLWNRCFEWSAPVETPIELLDGPIASVGFAGALLVACAARWPQGTRCRGVRESASCCRRSGSAHFKKALEHCLNWMPLSWPANGAD